MGAILLVQIDEALTRALAHAGLPAEDVSFEVISPAAIEQRLVTGEPAVDALVVGPATDQPLRIAQYAGITDRTIPVLILTTPERQPALQRALQFTPLLGEDVRCLASDSPDAPESLLGAALAQIRQRKQHQRTLQALNERLTVPARPSVIGSYLGRLLDHAPIGIVAVDADGSVLTWNPKATDILERAESAALGVSLPNLFPPAAEHRLRQLLSHCRASDRPDGPLVLERTRTPGEPQFVEAIGVALPSGPTEPVIIILLQEVTERVLAERERVAALEREQAAVRVRDDFLSIAAHELKTPVTSLLLATQVLRHKIVRGAIPDPPALQHAADLITQQGQKLARMIDQLLDISSFESGRMTLTVGSVDLKPLVEDVVAGFRLRSEKHEIATEVPESVLVTADSLRIEQILSNLLDNALKYSPKGGRITVALEPAPGGWVRLRVADQGLGVPPEYRASIFERFHQAHTTSYQSGMGLGLYISQQIARLHGGYITVEFPVEGGSIFSVHLPSGPPPRD